MPKRIPELTNYLCDLHYKKYGVFSRKKNDLFKFWKDFVSYHYRISNKKNQNDMSYSRKINMRFDGADGTVNTSVLV